MNTVAAEDRAELESIDAGIAVCEAKLALLRASRRQLTGDPTPPHALGVVHLDKDALLALLEARKTYEIHAIKLAFVRVVGCARHALDQLEGRRRSL